MMPVLSVRGLTISFARYEGGAKRLISCVKGLDLDLPAGAITAVVGESGGGKSLLAHAILGILPSNATTEGRIDYIGQPLTPQRTQALRGREIVLVPQGVGYLDPLMQVGPQLSQGRRGRPVRSALARYGLGPEVEGNYPFELSGGMARRVLLASAVLDQPRLVVADEPTPGLDAATAARVMGHFRELAQGGAAVLLITHDLGLAAATADTVAVLRSGVKAAEFPAALFGCNETPRDPYVSALWRAMPEHEFEGGAL